MIISTIGPMCKGSFGCVRCAQHAQAVRKIGVKPLRTSCFSTRLLARRAPGMEEI